MGLDRMSSHWSRTVTERVYLQKLTQLQYLVPVDKKTEKEAALLDKVEEDEESQLNKLDKLHSGLISIKGTPRGRLGFRVRPALGEPLYTNTMGKPMTSASMRTRSRLLLPQFTPPRKQNGRVQGKASKTGWFGQKRLTES